METTSLRQLLKSLCHNLKWEYAVFWKLKHRSRMLLTWEDGYCDDPKPREPMENMSDNVYLSVATGLTSFDGEINMFNEISVGYQIGLAVASMSCLLYSLGEGVVGRVASTGKHIWIYADEFTFKLLPEYADELQLQFAVGIKTILLVPVIPHGVVQLGSLETVTEDPALVALVRDMFDTFQRNSGALMPSISSRDLPGPLLSSLTSPLLEGLAETSANSCNILNSIQSKMLEEKDLTALDSKGTQKKLSKINPDVFSLVGQDNLLVLGKSIGDIRDGKFGALSMGPTAVSFPQNQFLSGNHLKMIESDVSNLSFLEEDIGSSSQCNLPKPRFTAHANVSPSVDMMDQQFGDKTGKETDQESSHEIFNFPADCELHKALGPALQNRCNEDLWNPNASGEDACSRSTLIYHTDFIGGIEPSVGESNELFVKGGDADNLLDAVVANMYDASGDIASNRFISITSRTTTSGQITASCQTHSQSGCSVLGENDLGQWSSIRPDFVSRHGVLTRSPSRSSLKSTRTMLIDEVQQKGNGCIRSRKGTKLSHTGQKKPRCSDVQRPRPRDRQMIQDRVKELRELVPNGAKCSIDALLDQTIKHMQFLRSVTNRAEKLKQCVYPEALDRSKRNSSENQDQENGASWAFELGSQFGVCPIVVKDLEQPGHMLIEMLCEENGLFLEIAQVIRRLELTILKGVMENHLDKSWAHFIVEASTGFRRMDIFWPLMRLLQRNSSISSMI